MCKVHDGFDAGDKVYELKKINKEGKQSYELSINGADRLVLADTHTRVLTYIGEGQIEETFPQGKLSKNTFKSR